MAVIIQIRNDIAANWTEANPVLASGEIGIETDTKKTKMGDGSTTWNNLPYLPWSGAVDSVNGKTGVVVLDAEDVGALPDNTFIPTKTSDIQNDSGFITASALEGYATESWVGQQGYLTSTALEGYATEQWVGQQGYLTGITSSDVTSALGYTPYDSSNPSGYTSNVGTVTSVNNVSPVNGNVTLSIPSEVTETTVSNWGFTKNTGTVTSVNNTQPVDGNVSLSIPTDTNDLTNGAGFITSSALSNYEQKSTITALSATDSITLTDNTIYNGSTQTALTIALWSDPNASSICEIVFTSGSTATTLTYPNTIKWIGDDISNNVFTPDVSKRYTVILYYDGTETVGVVKGVS